MTAGQWQDNPMGSDEREDQMQVVGYTRLAVLSEGSRAALDRQRAAIEAECARRGWTLVDVAEDVAPGTTLDRTGLHAALARLDAGEADALLAVSLDRLSRSPSDVADLAARARVRGWSVRTLDPDMELAIPASGLADGIVATATPAVVSRISRARRRPPSRG